MLLWVGWYGFNTGSTGGLAAGSQQRAAANAAMTTTLAGATGGLFAAPPRFVISRGHIGTGQYYKPTAKTISFSKDPPPELRSIGKTLCLKNIH